MRKLEAENLTEHLIPVILMACRPPAASLATNGVLMHAPHAPGRFEPAMEMMKDAVSKLVTGFQQLPSCC